MKKQLALAALALLVLISCKVKEKTVTGSYESNYTHKLRLQLDHSFTIEYEVSDTAISGTHKAVKVTGQWALKKKYISLAVDDKKYKFWECWALKVKGSQLKRPAHCTPAHHFIIFKKAGSKQ